jgi:Na+-translocating ferredoxin:NAD+ oxidoreductase RnfD subunit
MAGRARHQRWPSSRSGQCWCIRCEGANGFALLTGQDIAVRLLLELFPTGVLFFAFFMLTDPATSPHTPRGLMMYGGLTALLCFGFRLLTSPVQSLLFALLAANLFASRIDTQAEMLKRAWASRSSYHHHMNGRVNTV